MIRVPHGNPSRDALDPRVGSGANATPTAPLSSSSSASSSSSSASSRAPLANGSAPRPPAEATAVEVDDNAVRAAFEQLETTIERASELARQFETTRVDASLRRALTDLFFLDAPSPEKKDRLERSRAWVTALPMEKLRDRTVVARLKDLVRERLEIEARTKRYRARVTEYCRGFLPGGDRRSPEADDGHGTPSPSEEDEFSDEEDANPKGAAKQPASIFDTGSDVVSQVFRLMRCGSGAGPVAPPPDRRYVATSRGYVSSGSSDSFGSPPRRGPSISLDDDGEDSDAADRPLARKRERTPPSSSRATRPRPEPSSSSSSSSSAAATRGGTSLLTPLRVDPAPSWDSVVASGTALKHALSRSESFDSTGSWEEASPSSSSRADAASKGAPPRRKSFVIVQRSTSTVARKPAAPPPKPPPPPKEDTDDDEEESEDDAEEEAEEETPPRKRARRDAGDDDADERGSEAEEGVGEEEEEEEDEAEEADEDEVDRILAGEDGDDEEEEGESTSDRDEDAKEEEEAEKEEESEFAVLGDDDEEPEANEGGAASDAEDDVKIFGGDESDAEGETEGAGENEPAVEEEAPSGKEEEDDDDVRLFGEGEEGE